MSVKNSDYAQRLDGWMNVLTGLGTLARDKTRHAKFFVNPMSENRQVQEELWQGDDIFARAVEVIPDEMLRAGFTIDLSGNEDAAEESDTSRADFGPPQGSGRVQKAAPNKPPMPFDPDTHAAQVNDILAHYEGLNGDCYFQEAMHYERAYGGGLLIMGANDGRPMSAPLDETNIRTFDWCNVLTPREAHAITHYTNPQEAKYGQVKQWRIVPATYDGAAQVPYYDIHESRVICFPGISTSQYERVARLGWGTSILVRMLRVLQQFQASYEGISNLMSDFATATFKQEGLAELLAQNDDKMIVNRARIIDMTRSIARTVMIDSREEYKRDVAPLTGVPEVLEAFEHRLAAAAEMPVSLLMGRVPTGLSANGDGDMKFFKDKIAARQRQHLRPRHARFLKVMMLAKDSPTKGVLPKQWKLKYNPLYQPTGLEVAQTDYYVAQGDNLYINNGTFTPEEVAASRAKRFGIVVNIKTRMELAAAYEESMAQPPALDPSGKPPLDQPDGPRPAGATPVNLNAGPKPVKQPLDNPRIR